MAANLYLDSARLGLMSPSAQAAQRDFARLAGEEGLSLYSEQLLQDGFRAWPTRLQRRYPYLNSWHGVAELTASLCNVAGRSNESTVYLAGRSSQLMKMALRVMLGRCRRVLTTDLTWPAYRRLTCAQENEYTSAHTAARVTQASPSTASSAFHRPCVPA